MCFDAATVDVAEGASLARLLRRGGLHRWQSYLFADRVSPKFVGFGDAVVADCGEGGSRADDLQILTLATVATSVSSSLINVIIRPLLLLLLPLFAASFVECLGVIVMSNGLLIWLELLNCGRVNVRGIRPRMDGRRKQRSQL